MAIRVDYNKRMGYYLAPTTNGKTAKVWLCGANCLWAEINFYRKEEDGKGWIWRNYVDSLWMSHTSRDV